MTASLTYRPDVEGLRAVAISLVVAAHAKVPFLSGGFIGVDVFFVLSGFLITSLLLREWQLRGRIDFVEFYARRIRRLSPALFFMLFFCCAASIFLLGPQQLGWQLDSALFAATWSSNLFFAFADTGYFDPSSEENLFLHTWSLGVEEQFYLLWPAVLAFLLSGKDVARRLIHGIVFLAAISFILCLFFSWSNPIHAFFLPLGRIWQFALGAALCLAANPVANADTGRFFIASLLRSSGVIAAIGLCLVMGAAFILSPGHNYPGLAATLPSFGAACLLLGGNLRLDNPVSRLLSFPPLQRLGNLSYSWYLWHWPILTLGELSGFSTSVWHTLLLVAASLSLAIFSFHVVEKPLRRHALLVRHPKAVLASLPLMIIVSMLAKQSCDAFLSEWMQNPEVQRLAAIHSDIPSLYAMGCDEWYHTDRLKVCRFGPENSPHKAVLVGDSIAGQWFPAVQALYGDKPDWQILVATKSSCPMVDEPYYYARIGREYTECAQWRQAALQWLRDLHPDVIFMSTHAAPFTPRQWENGTRRVLDTFAPSAGTVILINATPRLPFDGPDCLVARSWRAHLGLAGNDCSAPAHDPVLDAIEESLRHAAAAHANVRVVDMREIICPNGLCLAERDGMILWRDTQHLTASFVRTLAPTLGLMMADVPH